MSLTLFKKTGGFPILDLEKTQIVLAGEQNFFESTPFKNYFMNISTVPYLQVERVSLENVFSDRIVIFAMFTSVAAWKGTSGIDDAERKMISELIRVPGTSIVISFGCPYVLRYFKEADILIAAYEATEQAQGSVIKCLQGEIDFQGRLPVKI